MTTFSFKVYKVLPSLLHSSVTLTMQKTLTPSRHSLLKAIDPNAANVDAATYPLARPLFMYTDAGIVAEKPQVGQFLAYALSNVNNVVVEVGYFPHPQLTSSLLRLLFSS
jgi:ABC-type phosphate transport system substrate-binding protein